jgi:peroxiredoxin
MKNYLKFLLVSSIAAFIALTAFVSPPNGYKIGDKAADFSLKGVDGKMHSLSEIKNAKGYIVIFTCNHCPYAKMYEDRIIALHKKYSKLGYPVVAINPNDPEVVPEDSFEEMKTRSKEKNFGFNYLIDEKQTVFPQYGATKTPHVFLLDKNKVVRYIGAIDDNAQSSAEVKKKYLELAIEAIDKGKKPNPETTKALGCSIKTK